MNSGRSSKMTPSCEWPNNNKQKLRTRQSTDRSQVQMDAKQTKNSNGRPNLNSFLMFAGRGKLTFGKQSYIGNFHDDKMIGPGTYIFPNGTQQHGEYIVVEEELEEPLETFKGKDGETEHRSRTKQVKIKWISRNGDVPPVTVVKKETIIN